MGRRKPVIVIATLSVMLACSLLMNLSQYQNARHANERYENPLLYSDSFVLSELSPKQCDETLYTLIRIELDGGRDALRSAVAVFYKKHDIQTCQRINQAYVVWQWLRTLPDNVEWCQGFVQLIQTDLYSVALAHEILARNGNHHSLLWLIERVDLPEYAPVVQGVLRFYVETDGSPDETPTLDIQTARQLTFDADLHKWRRP